MSDVPVLRFDVGRLRCTVLSDGDIVAGSDFIFATAPAHELEPLLRVHRLDPGAIRCGLNCLVVDAAGQRVLLDTGMGVRSEGDLGRLEAGLAAAAIPRESIDVVVISHFHPDHIGGLTDAAGKARYPRARILVAEAEWDHFRDEHALRAMKPGWSTVARDVLPAIAARVEILSGAATVADGVDVIPSPGHTPGHLSLYLTSDDHRLLCVGDAVGHPLNIQHPEWLVGSDGDGRQTVATRRSLLERAVEDGALVFANHFLFPGLGRVERRAGAYRWRAWTAGEGSERQAP